MREKQYYMTCFYLQTDGEYGLRNFYFNSRKKIDERSIKEFEKEYVKKLNLKSITILNIIRLPI